MQNLIKLRIGFILILAFVLSSDTVMAQSPIPILAGPGSQNLPKISDKYIVYSDNGSGINKLFAYNMQTGQKKEIRKLENRSSWDVSGNHLYSYWVTVSGLGLYIINIDTNETIAYINSTQPGHGYKPYVPAISGNLVIYHERNGSYYGRPIPLIYDINTRQEKQLVYDNGTPLGDFAPSAIDQNMIAGHKTNVGLVTYKLNANNQVISGSEKMVYQGTYSNPDISGNNVTWGAKTCSTCIVSLFLYDLSTDQVTNLSEKLNIKYDVAYPKISTDLIVWQSSLVNAPNADIYAYDLKSKTMTQLTTDPNKQLYQEVQNRKVVWADFGPADSNPDIHGVDLAKFLRGDADGDAKITVNDATKLNNYLFLGGTAPGCREATDANDDGLVDVSDSIKILNTAFLGDTIPAPFPQAGLDPTPFLHSLGCAQSLP